MQVRARKKLGLIRMTPDEALSSFFRSLAGELRVGKFSISLLCEECPCRQRELGLVKVNLSSSGSKAGTCGPQV